MGSTNRKRTQLLYSELTQLFVAVIVYYIVYLFWEVLKLFEVSACILNVNKCCTRGYGVVRHDDHHVRIWSKVVNICSKIFISDLHTLKLSRSFAATQFELFDDITNFLESMRISCFLGLVAGVRYHEERGSFK